MATPVVSIADQVRDVLDRAAAVLGTARASDTLGSVIDDIFQLPPAAPEYRRNGLMPDSVPCEISFSENELNTLRFAFELVHPDRSLAWRRQRLTHIANGLVRSAFGDERSRWFMTATAPWWGEEAAAPRRFSAWMAPVVNAGGLQALKVYYEAHDQHVSLLASGLAETFTRARTTLPDLVPWYVTFRSGATSSDQRLTVRHRGELSLDRLAQAAGALGLRREYASLEPFIRLVVGDAATLSDRMFLFGLGDTRRGVELKLELVLAMVPQLDRVAFQAGLEQLLHTRPAVLDGLATWLRAFGESSAASDNLSVLSVRIAPGAEPLINLYLRHPVFRL